MACFTADKSSGDVVVVVALAKGGTGLAGGANIGACPTGGSSRASAGDALTGTSRAAEAVAGAIESGAAPSGSNFSAPRFGVSALPSFSPLIAGRCRGKGTSPDNGAACAPAPRTQTQASTVMVRKAGTFPPGGVSSMAEILFGPLG